MSHESDPNFYSMMLGLPEELRRPNHYQLIGVDPFAADAEAIKAAAAEKNGKLMAWQNSKYFKEAGRLMLELATARGVLLDEEKRRAYDEEIGLAGVDEEPVVLLEAEPEEEPIVLAAVEDAPARKSPRTRPRRTHRSRSAPQERKRIPPWQRMLLPAAGLVLFGAIVWAGFGGSTNEPDPAPQSDPDLASIENSEPPRPWKTDSVGSKTETRPAPVSFDREPTSVSRTPLNQSASDPAPPVAKAPFDAAKAKSHQAEWATYLEVPEETTNSLGMKLRLIPPGEFQMGSPVDERGRFGDESLHPVRITKAFYIGTCEVTVKEYLALVQTTSRRAETDQSARLPISEITWLDAIEYCNLLSEKEGLPPYYEVKSASRLNYIYREATLLGGEGYRLPTEAEWEYACRAGTTTMTHIGDAVQSNHRAPQALPEQSPALQPVGTFPVNPFGLYNLHGNAGEWCFDNYVSDYYESSPHDDPVCILSGRPKSRVYRGGSRTHLPEKCRSAARMSTDQGDKSSRRSIGFRVVRNVKHPPSPPHVAPISTPPAPGKAELAKVPFDANQAIAYQNAWAHQWQVPMETTNSAGMKMRLIPPGEFLMGSPEDEPGRRENETQHLVQITKPYYCSVHEVTTEQYLEGLDVLDQLPQGRMPQFERERDWPFTQVNYWDAIVFCNELSKKDNLPPYYEIEPTARFSLTPYGTKTTTNRKFKILGGPGYRLPSEAEWEYACRAGTTTATHFGDSLGVSQANINGEPYNGGDAGSRVIQMPVGSFPANAFGLHDMHGSVFEWCADPYEKDFYLDSPVEDPIAIRKTKYTQDLTIRGGSRTQPGKSCRSAYRMGAPPHYISVGIRVVRNPKPGENAASVMKTEAPSNSSIKPPQLAKIPFAATAAVRHQTEWATFLNLSLAETTKDGLELKLIPAGEFQMGSPENEAGRKTNEDQHKVRLTEPFYMGKTEVTNREFANLMGERTDIPERLRQQFLDRPVTGITWYDAAEFCNQLSRREGLPPYYAFAYVSKGRTSPRERFSIRKAVVAANGGPGYRLPTEAEWEFACRAGTDTPWHTGSELLPEDARINPSDGSITRSVDAGTYPANAFGLFDMHGNVHEWCEDYWDDRYYASSPLDNPKNVVANDPETRVMRGGSDADRPEHCRSASRFHCNSDHMPPNVGFRVARTPKAK